MYEDILLEIGLTKSEIAVYFALLELGKSTTGPIIKKAQIASGKAYLILDKLVLKGLVTYGIQSGVKYFQAKNPERLLDYLEEKENNLKQKKDDLRKVIPLLKTQFDEKKYKLITETYEGWKGFRTFYEWTLKELAENEEILVLGVSKPAIQKFNAYIMDWNLRRIQKKIYMKILYNHDCREFGTIRKKLKLTSVRYLPAELETPAWVVIFKDYVTTINVHQTPLCFLIRNNESADTYRKYFHFLWSKSKV
ncbi:TPA: TrmB family transcriptional regulator [Candidatus Woesearchaeota archaeon]|nr:TrmB family transcriptional regulator [Candidatus Woesearchaeota archaeon]